MVCEKGHEVPRLISAAMSAARRIHVQRITRDINTSSRRRKSTVWATGAGKDCRDHAVHGQATPTVA